MPIPLVFRFPLLLPHSWVAMQCVRQEPLFTSYYQVNYTFPPPPTDGLLPPWYDEKKQELLEPKKLSSRSPRHHLRRGSEINENSSPKDRRKFVDDSPKSTQNNEGEENVKEEAERESWMKSGHEKGVYRPRMRRKPRKKEEDSMVWSVPST